MRILDFPLNAGKHRMLSRLQKTCRANLSRGLILCGVVGLLLSHFPLPVPHLVKDASRPFPCLDRACGCHSAEQCWKRCCCFTNRQKVAWAKARNVHLPEFVHIAAQHEAGPASTPAKACCQHTGENKTPRSCPKPVTGATEKASGKGQNLADTNHGEAGTALVIGVHAQQCQGQSTLWSLLPWSVVSPRTEFLFQQACLGSMVSVTEIPPPRLSADPPVPPPRGMMSA